MVCHSDQRSLTTFTKLCVHNKCLFQIKLHSNIFDTYDKKVYLKN
jgi:hypothetical protein